MAKLWMVGTALALSITAWLTAESASLREYVEYDNTVKKRILGNYVAPTEAYPHPNGIQATVRILRDGTIGSVKLMFARRDPEIQFSLLEAIYSCAPFPPVPEYEDGVSKFARDQNFVLDLSKLENLGPALAQTQNVDLPVVKRHPRDTVTLHLIPLDVLNRYPGVFSRSELLATENLKLLPKATSLNYTSYPVPSKNVMSFFKAWEGFFSTHPKASREEIMSAKERAVAELATTTND